MSPKTVDVLIFIPLIPAIPVIITWYLPWERWIPRRIPKSILGPYLLYGTFAAWHFRMPTWFILLIGAGGVADSAMAVFNLWKRKRLMRARDWPAIKGSMVHVGESHDGSGVKVTLTYTYRVQGKLYAGIQSFAFRRDEDAARFKDQFKAEKVEVHYRSDKPDVSAIVPEEKT
jgi:hypothetical protein